VTSVQGGAAAAIRPEAIVCTSSISVNQSEIQNSGLPYFAFYPSDHAFEIIKMGSGRNPSEHPF
jgi:hypothetical protein